MIWMHTTEFWDGVETSNIDGVGRTKRWSMVRSSVILCRYIEAPRGGEHWKQGSDLLSGGQSRLQMLLEEGTNQIVNMFYGKYGMNLSIQEPHAHNY